jgi:hypothetical protein
MPVLAGIRRPTSVPAPSPATASKTSWRADASKRMIEHAFAPKTDSVSSTIDCSCARRPVSLESGPALAAARSPLSMARS